MIKGCIFDLFEVILKEIKSAERSTFSVKSISPDDLTDGFLVFLKELKNKGIQVAVVSNFPQLKAVLNRLRITHLLNIYQQEFPDFSMKSKLDNYHKAAKSMNLNPEDIVIFTNEDGRNLRLMEYGFRVIYVSSLLQSDDKHICISDFSNLKFNQLITRFSNFH
jgi:beta-phosphoglucomutase-like phosphatase (HAD superfamily)